MELTKIGHVRTSNQFEALGSSELTSVAGGNSLLLAIPFAVGVVIGDALWGNRTMSMETWFNTYVK
jgi:hypothetical protein